MFALQSCRHYTAAVPWEVLYSEQAADWLKSLSDDDFDGLLGAIERLEQKGPALGRPTADRISGSRHQNMKELRYRTLRALFIFDPARRAIVLLGGDKRGDWSGWYERTIPEADDLYDDYLKSEDAP